MGRPAAVIAIVVLIAAAVFFWIKRGGRVAENESAAARSVSPGEPGPASGPPDSRRATPDRAPAPRPLRKGVRRLRAKQDRQRLLRAIQAARAKREARPDPADTPSATKLTSTANPGQRPSLAPGKLDKAYIQSVIRGAIPMVRECFTLARDSQPDAQGKLTVEFTIVGEQGVGGLVETARVISDNPLSRNKTMAECMTETMMSLEYPAPEGGGLVTVRYPFVFRSDPDGK